MDHLALTSDHERNTSNIHVRKARPTLTSDHERNKSSHLCQKNPTLTSDHERNQSRIHVRKDLHLHPTMRGTNPTYMSKGICTYIWPCKEPIQHTCRKGSTLISDHVRNQSRIHFKSALHLHLTMRGTNPTYMSEGLCTYIWSCHNTSHGHIRMGLHLDLIMWEHIPQSH